MQVYNNSKRESIKTFLFFLVILFIAYLPVSSFQFFLKNDAFNGYFPPKFFMSESIQSGYLPLWNPYINFGLPQYGDMSSGFWSPVTWLIASTIGYTAYTFTLELLVYILASGTGMYILCRFYEMDKAVCLVAGVSYMCGGYMIGHLQHFNWISGAALLPWCLWAYQRLQQTFSLKQVLTASLLFYLLAASAHPGITIGALYFFTAYTLFCFFKQDADISILKKFCGFTRQHIVLLLAIVVLSAGMIAGYADMIPHITRGEKVKEAASITNPVSIQSSISMLLPMSSTKNDHFFATDPSMRNLYFGITLLLFFLWSLFTRKNNYQKFFLIAGIAFFLLSTNGIFKTALYKWAPMIAYVRMNGEFAIFSLFSFILTASFTLNQFFRDKKTFTGSLKILYYTLEIFIAATIVFGFYKMSQTHDSFIFHLKNINAEQGIPQKLKLLLDSISFYDACWLQGIIQLFLLWGIKWCLMKQHSGMLVKIVVAEMIFASLLNIPFTGVGKASVHEVQTVLNKSPKGIIAAPLKPVNLHDTISVYESGLVGNWSFYNKQPGNKAFAFYPVELKNTKLIYADSNSSYFYKPYLFTKNDSTLNNITITGFTGSRIAATINASTTDLLVLQQNIYPHWFVYTNNNRSTVADYGGIFPAAPIIPGTNKIEFIFEPSLIKKAMLVSAIAFIIYLSILIFIFIRQPSPSLQGK